MNGLGLVVALPAAAAIPVVSSGEDPRLVLTRAAAATERPPAELRAVTFPELAAGTPAVVEGGGTVEECRGQPSTMGTVRESIDRAERALAYLEFDKARAHLSLGHGQLRCLAEPVDARAAAQLYFLSGFVAASREEDEAAGVALGRALAFSPGFTWDDTYPPDGKELLDALREAGTPASTELMILPVTGRGDLWVDGRPTQTTALGAIELPLGPHLIQVATDRISSYWIDLRLPESADVGPQSMSSNDASEGEGETPGSYPTAGPLFGGGGMPSARARELAAKHLLVVPALLPLEAATWSVDEDKQDELMLIIASMMEPDSTVYFSASGEVVHHVVGRNTWERLEVPTNLARIGGPTGRLIAGKTLFWTGSTALVAGLGFMGVTWLQAREAANTAKATPSWDVFKTARTDYSGAAGRMTAARITSLAGLGLTGLGIGLQYDDLPNLFGGARSRNASARFGPAPDGTGVGLTVSLSPTALPRMQP